MKTVEIVKLLSSLSMGQMEAVAVGLAWYDPCHAERLKNVISVAQQERDLADLDLQKQHEMMSRAADEAYLDYAYNDLER